MHTSLIHRHRHDLMIIVRVVLVPRVVSWRKRRSPTMETGSLLLQFQQSIGVFIGDVHGRRA